MKKIIILGKTGMLGSTVFSRLTNSGFEVVATTRQELDASNCPIDDIQRLIAGCDYAINCIGIIKPYIHDDNAVEVQRAIEVNSLFPYKLAHAAENNGIKVIQIATDCVYDGKRGLYNECDAHNATDVYGKSKSLGEVNSSFVLNLRCSIIGREIKGHLSLMDWFLNQPKNAVVNGYKNHLWNGVTTNAFADLCIGLIQKEMWFAGTQHVIPADIVSKAQMLKMFAETFRRDDIKINDINAEQAIDRTITTNNKTVNEKLWEYAGHKKIPTVKEMIGAFSNE